MNYCTRCGKEYEGDPGFCPECGATNQYASSDRTEVFYTQDPYQQVPPQQPPQYQTYQQAPPYQQPMEVDAPNTGFAILSFFFPTIGLILYLVWKDKTPLKAKSCGKGALIGTIAYVVLGIVIGVVYGVLIAFVALAPLM